MNKDKIREIRGKLWNDDFWAIKKLCDALLEEEPLHPDDPDYEYEWPRVDEVMPAPNVVPLPGAVFNIKATSSDEPNVEEPKQLLPCPACGGEAMSCGLKTRFRCSDSDCCLWGPIDDPTGEKWNNLPRRTT